MATTAKKAADKSSDDKKGTTTKKADGTTDKRTTKAKSTKAKSDGDDKESKPKKTTTKAADKDNTKTAEKKPAAKSSTKKAASSKKDDDNYTDPELREKLKEKIKEGDKGGKPGQWSARKSQLLAHEYEKEGGGYKSDKKTEKQKDLEKWTDEDWQTSDGKPAEREGGTTRYLPKEAWDKLSDKEKKETNAKKVAGSKKGEQNVPNTEKAKKARKAS